MTIDRTQVKAAAERLAKVSDAHSVYDGLSIDTMSNDISLLANFALGEVREDDEEAFQSPHAASSVNSQRR